MEETEESKARQNTSEYTLIHQIIVIYLEFVNINVIVQRQLDHKGGDREGS